MIMKYVPHSYAEAEELYGEFFMRSIHPVDYSLNTEEANAAVFKKRCETLNIKGVTFWWASPEDYFPHEKKVTFGEVAIFSRDIGEPISKELVCGLHSGIPPCCVAFYIKCFNKFTSKEKERYTSHNKGGEAAAYIQCPSCWLNRYVVKIHRCGCALDKLKLVPGVNYG